MSSTATLPTDASIFGTLDAASKKTWLQANIELYRNEKSALLCRLIEATAEIAAAKDVDSIAGIKKFVAAVERKNVLKDELHHTDDYLHRLEADLAASA